MKDWHVGQRVVCVYGGGVRYTKPLNEGKVYTIRDIFKSSTNDLAFRLEEVVNILSIYGTEIGYHTFRFRPLDESRLDQFRAHLKMVPKRVEERENA